MVVRTGENGRLGAGTLDAPSGGQPRSPVIFWFMPFSNRNQFPKFEIEQLNTSKQ